MKQIMVGSLKRPRHRRYFTLAYGELAWYIDQDEARSSAESRSTVSVKGETLILLDTIDEVHSPEGELPEGKGWRGRRTSQNSSGETSGRRSSESWFGEMKVFVPVRKSACNDDDDDRISDSTRG